MLTWTRSTTPTGAPVHQLVGGDYRVVASMSRSRIVGSRMVFGKMVSETDHVPRPNGWDIYRGDRFVGSAYRLEDAKRRAERLADEEARAFALAQEGAR